ncbi:benzoate 4-monooxygenase cytochrome P450 [Zalerion maritima]|uniref:Benzoate 4-monooxygenase cytochrome P450 n=1 Tax=Zalerion maritima TaxID=339359 RepID=A0AAD5RL61_9PEZI|nr:benzoate 4-monooxygenase cytochrome P450 [Zalerion maritima]
MIFTVLSPVHLILTLAFMLDSIPVHSYFGCGSSRPNLTCTTLQALTASLLSPHVLQRELAIDTVRKTFGTYKGLCAKVDYELMKNPADISRMNIFEEKGMGPAQNEITEMEAKLMTIAGTNTDVYPNQNYEWNWYPNGILRSEMNEGATPY